ncbi:ABC transporter ATP-binding protein [Jiangella mangrovi]|uniref:Peptide/nickel transport system ATP-binding protein/oligopeptide transport system ATP-binding protein n=1 Tax=Jiangella mangrovi TaxID=1524084 RepID=A0A7W9LIV7_9ACTN|nr:ABC transporter ATP-binding protein [Jiangella mangrovi]MBB5785440.1 peptide/nickel transport system ATP-binding protein/oligopeptide transport system ATP-binding protein [Jiangella mangrovi]
MTVETAAADRLERLGEEVLRVEDLKMHFPIRGGVFRREVGAVRAVDGVSFAIDQGETLSLVGESGCGKSTTGRMVVRLLEPTSGRILYNGHDLSTMSEADLRPWRSKTQIVFQDPYASLSPRMTVHDIIAEPLRVQGKYRQGGADRVSELLDLVGLQPEHANRYAHEFSGGQRQRIGIARALSLDPELLVLDEPVSALDVSIQAQVVNKLRELQQRLGLAYLFISHDLSIVRHVSHRIAVMYLGVIVETGTRDEIFTAPQHPYTQALLSAVPVPDPRLRGARERITLKGDVPNPANPPSGCRFRTRCWKAQAKCAEEVPLLEDRLGTGHPSACHFPELLNVLPVSGAAS